jgi:Neuraminidase (sialidase)
MGVESRSVRADGLKPAATRPADIVTEPATTIYRESGRYVSFPDVKRIAPHRLLCVFRDAIYPERIHHIERDARIVGSLSGDDGRTWSKPAVIYDDPACQNDPSCAVLPDGRLLLTFFSWIGIKSTTAPGDESPFARKVDRGEWGTWSEPDGIYAMWGKADPLRWEAQARHLCGSRRTLRATSSKVIETRRGTLLLPMYGRSPDKPVDRAFVLRSIDGGRTWSDEILIAADPEGRIPMQEPSLLQTANGEILSVMRTANAGDHLYMTRSTDDGLTWQPPQRTEIIGHPADLLLLPDGTVLLARGYRHQPFGVRAAVSTDNGRHWQREFVIADSGSGTDLGYPSVCLTDDGHVLVAYYMNGPDRHDRWIECKRIPFAKFALASE